MSAAQAALPAFLLKQRWYPAKNLGPPEITPLSVVPCDAQGVCVLIATWKVRPPAQPAMTLFVPVARVSAAEAGHTQVLTAGLVREPGTGEERALVDALSLDRFVRTWISLHLEAGQQAAPGPLHFGHTERLREVGLEAGSNWRIRPGSAEQSNTSMRIGERAILKVFRKLEPGVHPELEVGRYLTAAGFTATPALLGWSEIGAGPEGAATLSVLQSFVPNQGDGWSWILERLEQALLHDRHDGLSATSSWLQALARRTAQMHRVFAAATDTAAFQPEPVDASDLHGWAKAAAQMSWRAFEALESSGGAVDPDAMRLAAQLRARREVVEKIIAGEVRVETGFVRTRHHGDFHLGQTLVVGADAVILDFEGEPMRPIAERRAKHCVLRDVAGLVRSLSYVTAAAERAAPADLRPEAREALHERLDNWHAQAAALFVETYLTEARGLSSLPGRKDDIHRLLRFFLLEKALYEVAYEIANRPDWVGIPLQGVLNLLEHDGPVSA
jgi:trehalose synthase-fused probable maltokinase